MIEVKTLRGALDDTVLLPPLVSGGAALVGTADWSSSEP